jgi:putative polyhydroxyalkanoic acid system protein
MSEPLVVTIPHRLGRDEALLRVRQALGKASSTFPVLRVEEERWEGDRMDFRVRALGQTAAGNVQVSEQQVRLEVALPWLLQKFAEAVQRTVEGRGRILLEKK